MKQNRLRTALAEGRIPIGHMIMEFGTRGVAKILEGTGIDFLVVDMEHTGFDTERIGDLMAWLKATDITPFVRVPQGLYHFLARTMDAGALGVMVGNVETPEMAREIVNAVKYMPLGRRGVGLGTAHNDFVVPDPAAYFKESNENTTVICQIESPLGVKNADAIAQTPGVDILWVGHFDLSTQMGIPGQFQHPEFLAALRHVVEVCRHHGKAAGIQPGSMDQFRQWLGMGYNVISWRTDIAVYRIALMESIKEVRQATERAATA